MILGGASDIDWEAPYCKGCHVKLSIAWRQYGCGTIGCPNAGKKLTDEDVYNIRKDFSKPIRRRKGGKTRSGGH